MLKERSFIHRSSFIVQTSIQIRSRLSPLLKLFYNPLQAMTDVSAGALYIAGATLALLTTFAYYEVLSGQLARMISIFSRQSAAGVFAPFIMLLMRIITGIISDASPVLFLAVVFVPACLLAASIIHRR